MSDSSTTPGASSTMAELTSALRTLIGFGLGIAVSHGLIQKDTVGTVLGLVTLAVPLVWGIIQKRQTAKLLTQAQISRDPVATTPNVPK